MIVIILSCVIVVFVIVALCYLMVKLGAGAKTGRHVDVRVLSCEQKGESENRLYYEMKVDFYDANGDVLSRTMQSAKKYMPGDMIRCRYIEQTGMLFEEMAPDVKKKSMNNILLFLVIVLIFIGITVAIIINGGIPKEANRQAAYLISILFMAVGVFGIFKKNQMKQKMENMISLPGMQVDYKITQSTESSASDELHIHTVLSYHPVYEYTWEGERRRIVGPVGSSGKKYRSIGRKVHILVDPHTGKAICKEDEKANANWIIVFGIIGLIAFVLLLGLDFGVLS